MHELRVLSDHRVKKKLFGCNARSALGVCTTMTPTGELAAELDQDDVIVPPTTNIELARYIGGFSAMTPEVDRRQLIAADDLIVGSDFP